MHDGGWIILFLFVFVIHYLVKFLDNVAPDSEEDFVKEEAKAAKSNPYKTNLYAFREFKKIYLNTEIWRQKRNEVKLRDNYMCQICGSSEELHVHHMKGYDLIPDEPIECLITLCSVCHKNEHLQHGFPKTVDEYMKFNHVIPNNIRYQVQFKSYRTLAKKAGKRVEVLSIGD